MKLLLTGKNGQVGFELQRALAPLGEVVAVDQAECDLANPDAIRQLVDDVRPDVIVNPAAYTAVDKAETEQELAHAINARAPGIFGELAKESGALVIHYSTDYVFDGKKAGAYCESDAPNPQSVYGKTKLEGEQALLASGASTLIFRTSWVVGAHGNNFAKTILRLAAEREQLSVVADQWGAPTSAALLADVTAQIIARYQQEEVSHFPLGLYHVVASGLTNWNAYARYIAQTALKAGKQLKLSPEAIKEITTAEYPLPAKRPANSQLDSSHFQKTFGLCLPQWEQGLDHILQQILK